MGAATSYASPAGGAPAHVGPWPQALRRALREHGYTLGPQRAFAPTALVERGVWCSWVSIIRDWTPAGKSHVLRPRERLRLLKYAAQVLTSGPYGTACVTPKGQVPFVCAPHVGQIAAIPAHAV